jgi:hypothetical protein
MLRALVTESPISEEGVSPDWGDNGSKGRQDQHGSRWVTIISSDLVSKPGKSCALERLNRTMGSKEDT